MSDPTEGAQFFYSFTNRPEEGLVPLPKFLTEIEQAAWCLELIAIAASSPVQLYRFDGYTMADCGRYSTNLARA